MKYQLNLDYLVPLGDLAPYFEALQDGKAQASECNGCGNVCFPARAQCSACRTSEVKWKRLNGTARVLFRTDGASGSFALVKFDGADTHCTVGLINPERNTTFGKLAAPQGNAPGLWLALAEEKLGEIR